MDAEEYLESLGWHQDSEGFWNCVREKKHRRKCPDLVSALSLKQISTEMQRLEQTLNHEPTTTQP